jgi:hypothetical protein
MMMKSIFILNHYAHIPTYRKNYPVQKNIEEHKRFKFNNVASVIMVKNQKKNYYHRTIPLIVISAIIIGIMAVGNQVLQPSLAQDIAGQIGEKAQQMLGGNQTGGNQTGGNQTGGNQSGNPLGQIGESIKGMFGGK